MKQHRFLVAVERGAGRCTQNGRLCCNDGFAVGCGEPLAVECFRYADDAEDEDYKAAEEARLAKRYI